MPQEYHLSLYNLDSTPQTTPKDLFRSSYWTKINSSSLIDQTEAEILADEVRLARESSVKFGPVSIVALKGQEIIQPDLQDTNFWQFDPYPGLESKILSLISESHSSRKTSFLTGRQNLWELLQETSRSIEQSGTPIDIYNLTPTEAIFLIQTLLNHNLQYDDLVGNQYSDNSIKKQEVATGKEQLLKLYFQNPKLFQAKLKSYDNAIDRKTANQIIQYGFGVCRHFATISSLLYEILRSKQESVFLNGTYLIYHNERYKSQKVKASVGSHSYNCLYVVKPSKPHEINISVIDPTFALGQNAEEDTDFTYQRLSQACSSIREIGHLFGVANKKQVASELAKTSCLRLENIIYSGVASIDDVNLSDLVSLEVQATNDSCTALENMYKLFQFSGQSRSQMLTYLLTNRPIVFDNLDHKSGIFDFWLPAVIKQINLTDPSQQTYHDYYLLDLLKDFAVQINAKHLYDDQSGMYMSFLDSYHRYSKRIT